ncbi:MAG: glycosyltransferase [Gammaproteobacteria bacterium]|nr:glycosyltransferase [Gammaproteobacteria bacterium]
MAIQVSVNNTRPILTVLIIGFKMPEQLLNTVYSLSVNYQRNVNESDYEVIIVENRSDQVLAADEILKFKGNFRYILRDEPGESPAAAINDGVRVARGEYLCLMIDGARIASPGVVCTIIQATKLCAAPLISVPSYVLGTLAQHEKSGVAYDFSTDRALLDNADWRRDGYQLFNISYLCESNGKGFFFTIMESTCLTVRKQTFLEIGGADERFDLRGGGMLNLYLYRTLAQRPDLSLFLLIGEGVFHQYHGGATSSGAADKPEFVARMQAQYRLIADEMYQGVQREPVFLGKLHPAMIKFLEKSCESGAVRFGRYERNGREEWPHEFVHF